MAHTAYINKAVSLVSFINYTTPSVVAQGCGGYHSMVGSDQCSADSANKTIKDPCSKKCFWELEPYFSIATFYNVIQEIIIFILSILYFR